MVQGGCSLALVTLTLATPNSAPENHAHLKQHENLKSKLGEEKWVLSSCLPMLYHLSVCPL